MLPRQIKYMEVIALLFPDHVDIKSIMAELKPESILCLSDTADVLVDDKDKSCSLAVNLARQCELKDDDQSTLNITQADYIAFRYGDAKCGAHLPQNKNQPRREYERIDNTAFKSDKRYDIILGRDLLCCCFKMVSCGGIKADHVEQENFIKTLLDTKPNLVVISSGAISNNRDPRFYKKGKKELIEACKNLSRDCDDYDIFFNDNFLSVMNSPYKNKGHVIILAKRSQISISHLPAQAIKFTQEKSPEPQHQKSWKIKL